MTTSYIVPIIILYGYEVIAKQLESKAIVRNEKSSKDAGHLTELLPYNLQRLVKLASEKGLTILPPLEYGFTLHNGAFHDALALRYG